MEADHSCAWLHSRRANLLCSCLTRIQAFRLYRVSCRENPSSRHTTSPNNAHCLWCWTKCLGSSRTVSQRESLCLIYPMGNCYRYHTSGIPEVRYYQSYWVDVVLDESGDWVFTLYFCCCKIIRKKELVQEIKSNRFKLRHYWNFIYRVSYLLFNSTGKLCYVYDVWCGEDGIMDPSKYNHKVSDEVIINTTYIYYLIFVLCCIVLCYSSYSLLVLF